MGIINYFKKLFSPVEEPPDYFETCPQCKGMRLEDVFIDCEYCDGVGAISPQRVLEYERNNKVEM